MSRITLTGDYVRAALARNVPGAFFEPSTKTWDLIEPTPRAAAVALRLFPQLGSEYPELVALRDSLNQDVRPFDNATPYNQRIHAPTVEYALRSEGKTFYDFQAIDLGYIQAVLATHGGAYLGWERGLGKTLGACALIDATGAQRALVVCPNTAKVSVWKDEMERWLPNREILVLPNATAKRQQFLARLQRRDSSDPFVLIVHYEILSTIAGKKRKSARSVEIGRGWDKYGMWDLMIADEAHRIKDPKAQMGRALKRIPARYKLALSGSIIQNHAEELFSVLQWLFPDNYKSQWRDWNDRYLDYIDGPFGKICLGVKIETLADLRRELGVFMVYRRKSDELDLPAKSSEDLLVDLHPAQRKAYDDLRATCVAELADGTRVKSADGLAMLGKLRQIATGLDLLGKSVVDSSKLDLAVEIIKDNPDEAFVVFGWYRASLAALLDRLGEDECFLVDGAVPHDVRSEYIARFQAGEKRVFLGTLATLSESVTLHRASNAIFLDRSWNPSQNVQAEDRIYRIGQTKPVTITHLIARDTVDELRVQPTIANKEALRRLILGGV